MNKKKIWSFSRVKPADILVLLLLLGTAVFMLYTRHSAEAAAPVGDISAPATETIVLTCRMKGAFPWQYEAAAEMNFPQAFIESGGAVPGAYVTGVTKVPYVESNSDSTGKLVSDEGEFICDILFTVEAIIPEGAANMKIGTQEIRAGRGLFIRTSELDMPTGIEKIEFK